MPVSVGILNGNIFILPDNMIDHIHHNYQPILNLIRQYFQLPLNSPFEVKVYNLSQNGVDIEEPHHIIGPDDELFAVAVEDDQALHFGKKKKSIGKKKKSIGKKKKSIGKKKK